MPVVNRSAVKKVLRGLGIYPMVRYWYRQLNPQARREFADDVRFYRQFVGEGDLCFDIGANLGQTIKPLVACKAKVVAVEPNPLCGQSLAWEFAGCRDVTIVGQAVGAEAGFADLHFEGTDATASLRNDWPFPLRGIERVRVTTLDALIEQFGKPTLLKVDVEGFETEVFKGLSQPIPVVRFEYHRWELARALTCLARLAEVGEISAANVTELDSTSFHFPEWVSYDELVGRLENDELEKGNIVVKMRAQ
jgi:FkbM family methyltransferase